MWPNVLFFLHLTEKQRDMWNMIFKSVLLYYIYAALQFLSEFCLA